MWARERGGVPRPRGGAPPPRVGEAPPRAPGAGFFPAANAPCGRCVFCLNDSPYYFCENLQDYGNSLHATNPPHLFGGWAEYMYLLPGTPLFRVPDGLPDEVAALTEVMAVTHGFDRARMLTAGWGGSAFGESVAICGIGPLGFCHLVKARLMGCGKLIAIDRLDSRLELARKFGATLTINAAQTDEKERLALVREHTHTRPDIVVDCTGFAQSFPECLHLVRYGGTVVEAGTVVGIGPVGVKPHADHFTKDGRLIRLR